MLTTTARYGRPKGTGVDDSRQLESLAALLTANPALKPTTAIRSLGVEDPSVIRRLRDKFRMDQARLMADARRDFRTNAPHPCTPRPGAAGFTPPVAEHAHPYPGSAHDGDAARDYRHRRLRPASAAAAGSLL